MTVRVLTEAQLEREPWELAAAWSAPETFALAPAKTALTPEHLAKACAKLPDELQRDHFVLLTSGSTGLPKLVVGSRKRAEALARKIHVAQDAEPCAAAVVALPLSYSYAFVNQWVWSQVHGRELVVTRGLAEATALREALKTTARSQLCLVGAQVPLLSQLGAEPFPQVLRLNFAGGRFPQERLPELRERFPNARIFNNYGCAEAMPRLCVRPAEASDDASFIGAPLPGVELRVQQGELQFRSDTSAVGTLDAQGFAPIAADTWTATGDLAEAHPDGTFKLLGRAGEVFKRYGEKVSLVQLFETVQLAWPFSAGFYRQADRAGEDGCVLVLSPRPQEPDVRALLQQFRARHPRPHWPLRIESLELLPLLASGKVDTRALAAAEGKTVHWDQRL